MAVRVPVHDADYADHDGLAQSRPDHPISAHQAQKAVVAGSEQHRGECGGRSSRREEVGIDCKLILSTQY